VEGNIRDDSEYGADGWTGGREGLPIPEGVEVKARSADRFGGPEGAVDPTKQRRLAAAARRFIQKTGAELPARFDVVTFVGDSIRLYRDAFRID